MEQLFFQGLLRAKHGLGLREGALCNKTEKRQLWWCPQAGVEWGRQAGNRGINKQDESR